MYRRSPRSAKARKVEEVPPAAPAAPLEPWQADVQEEPARAAELVAALERGEPGLWAALLRPGSGCEEDEDDADEPRDALGAQRTCPEHPWPPLHAAAMCGDLNALRALVALPGCDLTAPGGCSARPPLLVALRAGRYQCVRFLWRHLNPAARATHASAGLKLLALCVRGACARTLEWLLAEAVSAPALLTRSTCGREECYKLLGAVFARHPTPAQRMRVLTALCCTPYTRSLALSAAAMKQCPDTVRMLCEAGARLCARDHA